MHACRRNDGWMVEKQYAFIQALAETFARTRVGALRLLRFAFRHLRFRRHEWEHS